MSVKDKSIDWYIARLDSIADELQIAGELSTFSLK